MSASPEDRAIATSARRSLAKCTLDISQLEIHCLNGVLELNGTVRTPRGQTGAYNVRKEFQALQAMLQGARGVRGVIADRVRIFE